MAWKYGSLVLTPQAVSGAGGALRLAEIFGLITLVEPLWVTAVAPVAFSMSSARAWGSMRYDGGDYYLAVANSGTGTTGSTSTVVAGQSYSGANQSTALSYTASYFTKGAGEYQNPITGELPAGAFRFSEFGTTNIQTNAVAERWHVWVDGPRIMIGIQASDAAEITGLALFGDFASARPHATDEAGEIQWTNGTSSIAFPTNSAVGRGQCFAAANTDTPLTDFTPIVASYGLTAAAQAGNYVAEPMLYASATVAAQVVSNNRVKGYLNPQDILAVPLGITSKKLLAPADDPTAYTHVCIGNGYALYWDPAWGSMP